MKNRINSGIIQSFAALSAFACNIAAWYQNREDLIEDKLYTDDLQRLNHLFLAIELLQLLVFALNMYCLY